VTCACTQGGLSRGVTLSGLNLPLDRVAAASGHIDALAKAAKPTGDPAPSTTSAPTFSSA